MDSIFGGMKGVNEEWDEAARIAEEEESADDEGFPCLRCGTTMEYLKQEKIQLGEQGGFSGTFNHLIAGALEVHIFVCPECGKLEFYDPRVFEYRGDEEQIAQVECPQCGKSHDMDYPKCPFCSYDYREND